MKLQRVRDLCFSRITCVPTAVSESSQRGETAIYHLHLGEIILLFMHSLFLSVHISPPLSFLYVCPPPQPFSHTHTDHHGDGRWREGLSSVLWKCRQNAADAFPSSRLHYLTSPLFTLFSIYLRRSVCTTLSRHVAVFGIIIEPPSAHPSCVCLFISFSDC